MKECEDCKYKDEHGPRCAVCMSNADFDLKVSYFSY